MAYNLIPLAFAAAVQGVKKIAPWAMRSMVRVADGKAVRVIGLGTTFVTVAEAVWTEFDEDGFLTESMEEYVYNTLLLTGGLEVATFFKEGVANYKTTQKGKRSMTNGKAAKLHPLVSMIMKFPTFTRFAKSFKRPTPATNRTTVVRDKEAGSLLVTTDGVPRIYLDRGGFRINGTSANIGILSGSLVGLGALSATEITPELSQYMQLLASYSETIFAGERHISLDTAEARAARRALDNTLSAIGDPQFFVARLTGLGTSPLQAKLECLKTIQAQHSFYPELIDVDHELSDEDDDDWWLTALTFFAGGSDEKGEAEIEAKLKQYGPVGSHNNPVINLPVNDSKSGSVELRTGGF